MSIKDFAKDVLETINISRIYDFRRHGNKAKHFFVIISKDDIKKSLNKKRIKESIYKSIIAILKDLSKYEIEYQNGGNIKIKVEPFNFKSPISLTELGLLNKIKLY